ncbi:MAG: DinB family protein [Acidobacteria bacterium]|nr:DinB family protein [Acidobacteriota bacterium]MBS1867986.1 DinB family protein [Acidobacteriota bacterium]
MPEVRKPEPWLRGRAENLPAVHLAVIHALELTLENIDHWCIGLTQDDFHARPYSLPSVAFHIRHIARSIDRLLTYAEGNQLTQGQLAALKSESEPTPSMQTILDEFYLSLNRATARIRGLALVDLELPRAVGRQQLPTTVGGLLVHIADHTQRHTGQAITTAKLLLALRKS